MDGSKDTTNSQSGKVQGGQCSKVKDDEGCVTV